MHPTDQSIHHHSNDYTTAIHVEKSLYVHTSRFSGHVAKAHNHNQNQENEMEWELHGI